MYFRHAVDVHVRQAGSMIAIRKAFARIADNLSEVVCTASELSWSVLSSVRLDGGRPYFSHLSPATVRKLWNSLMSAQRRKLTSEYSDCGTSLLLVFSHMTMRDMQQAKQHTVIVAIRDFQETTAVLVVVHIWKEKNHQQATHHEAAAQVSQESKLAPQWMLRTILQQQKIYPRMQKLCYTHNFRLTQKLQSAKSKM